MVDTGAKPVRVAVSAPLSGGSKLPSMRWISLMARPIFSTGTSSRKAYHGSNSWLFASISPCRTAR